MAPVRIHVSGQDHLQRDNARRKMLARAINDAHSAARDFLEYLEISEARARLSASSPSGFSAV